MCEIGEIKNLASASREEQTRFIESFDHVLSDMDGVIWTAFKAFPDAPECLTRLKNLGKRITYVTNNTTVQIDEIHRLLQRFEFPGDKPDVVTPSRAYINYLKSLKFSKKLFVIGGKGLKYELKQAGFDLAETSAVPLDETLPALMGALTDDEEVGAVIVDYEINITLMKLQKCLTYLKRPDCLFIIGTADKTLPFPRNGPLIGNHYFVKLLSELSERTPRQMAKPSPDYNRFIVENYSISNPSRVLFIGDSIEEDMKFAGVGGYKKLLVLSGSAKKDDVVRWTRGQDAKPDYYIDNLAALNLILGMAQSRSNRKI
ncbi:unnamed protein product [Phyllotreta striolata]|uniref:4-nitrophenylphosphatase n=1 Tax=Phyllotreta striolata TaxID=444603 RepID=A0A9N9XLM6_PHYSR|nr:unnamed protein product [Phyllotreta striolata]